jgi:riboflavin biosynthesis pyrimidine reductase
VGARTRTDREGGQSAPALLRRLLPPGAAATAAEAVEEIGLWRRAPSATPPPRPRVLLNMVSTADGRATLGGRSAPISGRADRELFHALRAPVDAVLAGAGTMRTERYGRLIREESSRRLRVERGLPEEPIACIVSRSLKLGADIPLLAEPASRVLVLTPSDGELPPFAADVGYVRAAVGGALDLAAALAQLVERHAVRTLLCEGGPHLACELVAAGLLDELFLSISPRLAGGDPAGGGRALRILAGMELAPPAELELLGALESDSHLFLRYGVVARVSRETMPSSSLAR